MDPTANYHKTKRILLVFVGALLLSIFAGLQFTNEQQPASELSRWPLQLKHPEFLSTILGVAVLFYGIQLALQWAAQTTAVQENRFHRWDFSIIAGTAAFSIFCYGYNLAASRFPFLDTLWAKVIIGIAGFLVFGVGLGVLIEKSSTLIGEKIKSDEAQEDERVMTVLKSKPWVLKDTKSGKGKDITFEDEDRIGTGLSDKLHSWRVKNGLLEILNNQGQIYSRFSYDRDTEVFDHTKDPDTISTKSQSIRPKPPAPPVLDSPMTTG
jgi:hypothetical protein